MLTFLRCYNFSSLERNRTDSQNETPDSDEIILSQTIPHGDASDRKENDKKDGNIPADEAMIQSMLASPEKRYFSLKDILRPEELASSSHSTPSRGLPLGIPDPLTQENPLVTPLEQEDEMDYDEDELLREPGDNLVIVEERTEMIVTTTHQQEIQHSDPLATKVVRPETGAVNKPPPKQPKYDPTYRPSNPVQVEPEYSRVRTRSGRNDPSDLYK